MNGARISLWVVGLSAAVLVGSCGKGLTKLRPDHSAPEPITSLVVTTKTVSSLTLQWSAPGDDGAVGTAAAYDLRYATSPITAGTFDAALPASGEPVPAAAGTTQTTVVTGLVAGSTYSFAMTTADEVPNLSPLSNVATGTTLASPGDGTPPGAITNLHMTARTLTTIKLGWTAPGDDGYVGTAASYDLRFSTAPITEASFGTATEVLGVPPPGAAGSNQSMTVAGLLAGTPYYFAIRTSDEGPNASALSNLAVASTLPSGTVFGESFPAYGTGGGAPLSTTIADLTGDGKADLVVPASFPEKIVILPGHGDGTFGAAIAYPLRDAPGAVATGDVNRDGRPDLVVAYLYGESLSVRLGSLDGSLGPSTAIHPAPDGRDLGLVDLNHDGKPDLVMVSYDASGVVVMLGNGDGTFGAATSYFTDNQPYRVVIGDLNHDGAPDLVVGNYASTTASVLLGNGDGTFAPKTDYGTGPGSGTGYVALGDLNGDGRLDLATASAGTQAVQVFLGVGDGTFGPGASFDAGSTPGSMAIADLDLDGKADLVATGSTGVSVWLGDGTGALVRRDAYAAGLKGTLTIGDLNQDSQPDLTLADYANHVIWVGLNIALPPPRSERP